MRRDYFTLEVANVDASGLPTVRIDFEGPSEAFVDRLSDESGATLDAGELDVTYRLQDDERGVFGVTNRITGEFIFEVNADTDVVLGFLQAARERQSDDDRYRLQVLVDGETVLDHEKETLLVYDASGDLLRSDSLIPSGVEL
jgi:hypothetical protein